MSPSIQDQMDAAREALKVLRRLQDLGLIAVPRLHVRTRPKADAKILWR